jgi:hypothetical protein
MALFVHPSASSRNTIRLGHLHIHQHHVGLESEGALDGLLAVLGLADDLEAFLQV